jgi:transposase-like protein
MNPLVPPAIAHLQANPGASIFNTAIDFGVSKSTLRRAWYKVRPGTAKVGRPQSDRTKRALAFRLANPGMTQVSIAKQFKITPVTLSRALKRNG